MRSFDRTDLLGGLIVIALGLYFAIGATEYRMGSVVRMGPGFVPFSLGVIGVLLGLAIVASAFARQGALPRFHWRHALFVLTSIPVFALLLPRAGLLPAALVAVLVSSAALPLRRPLRRLVLAVAVALLAWVVFGLLLDMPIPALRNPVR